MQIKLNNFILLNRLSKCTKVNEIFKRFMQTNKPRQPLVVENNVASDDSDSDSDSERLVNQRSKVYNNPEKSEKSTDNTDYDTEYRRQLEREQRDAELDNMLSDMVHTTKTNRMTVEDIANAKRYRNVSEDEVPEKEAPGPQVPENDVPKPEIPKNEATENTDAPSSDTNVSTLDMARKLAKDSEAMANKVVHNNSTSIDINRFVDANNTYQGKANFKSTVNEFVNENSAILLATDNLVKGIHFKLGTIAENLNIQVEKSEKLGNDWSIVMNNLRAYRKSLDGVNFKKTILTISAGIAALTFMYQTGIAGTLAKFGVGIISEIGSSPSIPNSSPISPFEGMVEKLKVPDSKVLNNVMENALTPGIILGVGLSLGTLMIAAKVLRALRYIIKK